jgi:hypothetical protein
VRVENLVGSSFGRLTVIARAKDHTGRTVWHCHCECGERSTARGVDLRSGHTKSCGCFRADVLREAMFKHGRSHTPAYRAAKARGYRRQKREAA